MKNQLLLCLSLLFSISLFSQQEVIQIAAFEKAVPATYFSTVSAVQFYKDYQGFYHYYINKPTDEKKSQELLNQYKAKGYHAFVMNLERLKTCADCCSRNQEIDCDMPSFRFTDEGDFEKVRYVLANSENYKVYFKNNARANNAKCYLNLRGISPCNYMGFITNSPQCAGKNNSDVFIMNENDLAINIEEEFKAILQREHSVNKKEFISIISIPSTNSLAEH